MPLLTGPEIARRVAAGELRIEPFDPANVNPNSYNLRLCDQLLVYRKNYPQHQYQQARWNWHAEATRYPPPNWKRHRPAAPYLEPLDMAVEEPTVPLTIPKAGLVLWPGVLYLGATLEYTESPGVAPKIDGRSSVGRLGKMIHVTAGFGDDNFCGDWTLEIVVVHPLRVYPGVPICQVAYSTLLGERQPYAGTYQGQRGPKASGIWKSVRKLLNL